MSISLTQANVIYFGKIPSRGDFVRSSSNTQLIETLDRWLAQAMELLATDPRWKITYDAAKPFHFVFLGSRSRLVLPGYLVSSSDSSQRRFPFISASAFEIGDPRAFMARSPLMLSRLWTQMENLIHTILDAPDASGALQAISQATVELDVAPNAYDANFADFLKMQTLASLEALLANAGHACSVRQAVLALGLLLQPVLTNSGANLEKSLRLPLPDDPLYRSLVASFWLDLISGFAARGDFEVGIFVTANQGGPALVVSFNGASAKTLQGLMDPAVGLEQQVSIVNSDWVEGYVEDSHAIKKLSSYMLQPQLSLYQTGVTFREVFLGA